MTFVRPDGFAGALMAAEGFKDVRTILHGPGGCRFRYMRLSRELYPREDESAEKFEREYFFGNPRIPCTYLDEKDYIYGGFDKIDAALSEVASTGCSMIAVMNSPATALIGDNITKAIQDNGLQDRAFTVSFNPVSLSMAEGFDRMATEIVRFAAPERKGCRKGTVNLLGIPILCRDWEGTVEEAAHILELMDFEVVTAVGAGSTMDDLRESVNSEFNISVFPEFCNNLGEYYENAYGIGFNRTEYAPVGFDATVGWINDIAELTGHDASKALEYVENTKNRVKQLLLSDERRSRMLTGSKFAIEGEGSVTVPLCRWLYEYLSMIPVSIDSLCNISTKGGVSAFLGEYALPDVVDKPFDFCDYLFSSGDYSLMCQYSKKAIIGIDIGFPPRREFAFNNRTIIGVKGALNLLDSLFNQI